MRHRAALPLAGLLFFLSGALGLGYQLVWIRKAALVVGASQIALSTVLTSFFLGLGLGSWFVGRYWVSRRRSPLWVYGWFEVGIGAFALLFPLLFRGLEAVYGGVYPWLADSGGGLFALRFGLLFGLFLVPTFFMGGTLPLLLDGLVERDESIGSLTSVLYGVNILGAVFGVLLTGYWAIPALGMNGTSGAAGVGNLLIGGVALVSFRGSPARSGPREAWAGSEGARFFEALAFASGLAAIGYQVAWARYFGLVMPSTVYLTAVLLAVYLAALSVGSLLTGALLSRGVGPLRLLVWLQPAAAVWVLWGLESWRAAAYELRSGADYGVTASWRFAGETADAIFFAPLFQVGLVVFGPVVLLGTALPALIAAATSRRGELRASAGSLLFWNTLGSSAGGFGAGYVLIPAWGLAGAFAVPAAITLALAAAAEWRRGRAGPGSDPAPAPWRPGYALSGLAALAGLSFLSEDVTLRTLLRYGVGRGLPDSKLLVVVEGPLTTASAFDGPARTIATGSTIHAHVRYGQPSGQAIHGHLPALLYPRPGAPRRVLGVALGSGQSFGALLQHPVESMDVVDISGEIAEVALRYFADLNHDLGRDPRVTFHLDDGRHFVERAPSGHYDVVTMESPPPTAEGAFSLYSLEFYREVRRILRDGGLFTQWLPLYHLAPNDLRGIVKTQGEVFPHSFVVTVSPYDFYVMSFVGDEPPLWSRSWIAERSEIYARERRVEGWRWHPECRFPIHTLEGILASFLTGPEDIAALRAPYVYRDDEQRLSYSSGDRHLLRRYRGNSRRIARLTLGALPLTPFAKLQRYFDAPLAAEALEEERACILQRFQVARADRVERLKREFEAASTPAARSDAALAIADLHARRFALEPALHWIGRAATADPERPWPARLAAARRITARLATVYASEVATWAASLPEGARSSPLIGAVREALDGATPAG